MGRENAPAHAEQREKKDLKYWLNRYFIQAMSAMALGLFSSLIIGLIISQFAKIPVLAEPLLAMTQYLGASSPVIGAAIGVAVSWGLKAKPLVVFSCAAAGAIGYMYNSGGPVGAYLAAVIGSEIGMLVAGKTPIDIIVAPMVTIISGGTVALLVGGPIGSFMTWLGGIINEATMLAPLPMGIVVSVIVGVVLTAPISSAAICIMLGLDGIAAGAAVVGCCANMVGFAVMSVKDNGWGSLLAVGIGTSMLQFANALKRPALWIPPVVASAILGPVSTCVFKMTNISTGAGMGTSGLVGQFGAFAAMSATTDPMTIFLQVALMHFIAPAAISWVLYILLRRIGWIKDGDLKLQQL